MSLTDELYDDFTAKARASYDERGMHTPILLPFGPKGPLGIILLHALLDDHIPRDLAYAVLRHMITGMGADSYILISESWLSKTTMPPSKDPERVETLWILGVFPDRRRRGTMMKVAKGKVFGEPMLTNDDGEPYGGGFGELLTGRDIEDEQIEQIAKTLAEQLREHVSRN